MVNFSELLDRWENSALELREAETLINLLIIDNKRLEKYQTYLKEMFDNGLGWEDMETDIERPG